MRRVLISVTTFMSDWQQQIKDIKANNIKEFALFLTGLKHDERPTLYKQLETIADAHIPFMHIHSDMTVNELNYLTKRFGAQYFNIHTERHFPLKSDISKYNDRILMENSGTVMTENDIRPYAGICLDISHLENDRLHGDKNFENIDGLVSRYPVIANHISGISEVPQSVPSNDSAYDRHDLESLGQLDYLKLYRNEKFLGQFVALELVNDIATQLKAKEKIESIFEGLL